MAECDDILIQFDENPDDQPFDLNEILTPKSSLQHLQQQMQVRGEFNALLNGLHYEEGMSKLKDADIGEGDVTDWMADIYEAKMKKAKAELEEKQAKEAKLIWVLFGEGSLGDGRVLTIGTEAYLGSVARCVCIVSCIDSV
ncbi:uncharacterized protein [Spinacia oleracea]|uniref:Uncharacterized protein n=1 Tax=Spinacia oleracea TaxID=3562 RepID=A0ABM3R4S6_SPIOL|nr:uncharacterized protein LOC130465795 [Spinacia oleracea]